MSTLPSPDSFELLSAYLDGELTPAETTQVEGLLTSSPAHRDEFARLDQARTWLRALPPVDPPEGFIEQAIAKAGAPVAPPKKRKWGMLNLVATAAVWVVVLGFVNVSRSHHVSPDVADFAQTHTEASAGFGGLLGSLGAGKPQQHQVEQTALGEPYWAPLALPGDLSLRSVQLLRGDLVGLVYANDSDLVMLYEVPGQVSPSALDGGQETTIDGSKAWVFEEDRSMIVVVQRADLVYAIAGPSDGALVGAVATRLPSPPSPSLADRLGSAGRGVLDSFGLG
ncbi:MAG TPA: zf-HC2 domain-containing protein [Acidimicrobiales bacterium]|nr:zf-HC2 domain-containing protein [Acidimicrobiales bacterium]